MPSLFGCVIRPLAKDVVAEQFVLMKDFLKGKVIPIKDGCWISVSNRRALTYAWRSPCLQSKSHNLQYPDAFDSNEFVFMVSSSDSCCDERWVA